MLQFTRARQVVGWLEYALGMPEATQAPSAQHVAFRQLVDQHATAPDRVRLQGLAIILRDDLQRAEGGDGQAAAYLADEYLSQEVFQMRRLQVCLLSEFFLRAISCIRSIRLKPHVISRLN